MPLKTTPFDIAKHLDNAELQQDYLDAAFSTEDAATIAHALGVVARAQGMASVARDTGLSRESLYKALSEDGNPALATVLKVMQALGLRLTVCAKVPG